MAKYQPVLTELKVRVKVFNSDMTLDLNTTPDTAGNAGGSGENCESQSNLSHTLAGAWAGGTVSRQINFCELPRFLQESLRTNSC